MGSGVSWECQPGVGTDEKVLGCWIGVPKVGDTALKALDTPVPPSSHCRCCQLYEKLPKAKKTRIPKFSSAIQLIPPALFLPTTLPEGTSPIPPR